MDNRIEDFIRNNREAFDDRIPDRSIWLSIENTLDKRQNPRMLPLMFLKIAAVFVVILGVGIAIGWNIQQQQRQTFDYTVSPELRQLKEAESYYKMQVSQKYNELKDTLTKANVANDLKQLEEIYEQLKSEMIKSDYSNSEMMINAMIKNHKTKIDILENILNKQKQNKNEPENMSL